LLLLLLGDKTLMLLLWLLFKLLSLLLLLMLFDFVRFGSFIAIFNLKQDIKFNTKLLVVLIMVLDIYVFKLERFLCVVEKFKLLLSTIENVIQFCNDKRGTTAFANGLLFLYMNIVMLFWLSWSNVNSIGDWHVINLNKLYSLEEGEFIRNVKLSDSFESSFTICIYIYVYMQGGIYMC
jgi:hypothetical protein